MKSKAMNLILLQHETGSQCKNLRIRTVREREI